MLTGTAEIILGCERNMHVVCEMHDNWHVQYISSSQNVNISYIFVKIYAIKKSHEHYVCATFVFYMTLLIVKFE